LGSSAQINKFDFYLWDLQFDGGSFNIKIDGELLCFLHMKKGVDKVYPPLVNCVSRAYLENMQNNQERNNYVSKY